MSSIRTVTEHGSMQIKWSGTSTKSIEYSPSGKKQLTGSSNKAVNARASKCNPLTATERALLDALPKLSSEQALRRGLEGELKGLKALREGEKKEMRALKAELKELKALKEKERIRRHDLESKMKESNEKLRVSEEKRERQKQKILELRNSPKKK